MWKASVVALGLGLLAGCGARGPAVFVPVVEREFRPVAAEPSGRDGEGGEEPAGGAPQIDLRVRVVRLPAAEAAQLPVDLEEPAAVLSADQAKALIERLGAASDVRVLSAPRLRVLSGQAASFQTLRSLSYVAGYEVEPDAARARPIVRKTEEGLALDTRVRAHGEGVLLTRFEARRSRLLTVCDNRAALERGGERAELPFHEPVLLVARSAVPQPCELALGRGQMAVVPLGERSVEVHRSNVRALAREGRAEVSRDATARLLAGADPRGFPLDEDLRILALVTARVAQP